MTWVAGANWVELGQKAMENMGRPDEVYDMPLCRFVVLFDLRVNGGGRKIESKQDWIDWRNERRKKAGKPPLTIK